MSLLSMRKRLPLWAFILLAALCLVMLGIACVCAADHPGQTIDRALGGVPAADVPLVEVWTFVWGVLALLVSAVLLRRTSCRETSRAALQCFLF